MVVGVAFDMCRDVYLEQTINLFWNIDRFNDLVSLNIEVFNILLCKLKDFAGLFGSLDIPRFLYERKNAFYFYVSYPTLFFLAITRRLILEG